MTRRRLVIAWDRDAQQWTVLDARTKTVAGAFPTLHAAEDFVLGLKDQDDPA